MPQQTYSVRDVARLLNVSEETVRRWIRKGDLAAVKQSNKEGNVITDENLRAFIEASPKYSRALSTMGLGLMFTMPPLSLSMSLASLGLKAYTNNLREDIEADNSRVKPESLIPIIAAQIESKAQELRKRRDDLARAERRAERIQEEVTRSEDELERLKELMQTLAAQSEANEDESSIAETPEKERGQKE